ncbi:uncharacterized protein BCR38DRAFT_404206 [Pseudomassariella vexata]|uniref:Uncharacterized protein n=1 Tax=Pseudomassariella vexata TaxID=1141098 RepID=A0A1Y2EIM6_9PEZI|nr:uncharacterized protein BCR38DRAFT_404206 [Pseudomassariella vexata]ORY71076.1 hypothetical protein BCR38DRAFT_404206 [Pseudomassariella vexata]
MALLLRHGEEDMNTKFNESIVLAAATFGQLGILDLISRYNGPSLRKDEWCTIARLYNAAKSGDVKILQRLLLCGSSPNFAKTRAETLLWVAAARGHRRIVEVLTQRDDV